MSKLFFYKIHKWIAVSIGGFLLTWLFSGIVMILPRISSGPDPVPWAPNVRFRDINLSPSEAVTALEKTLGTAVEVNYVNLRRIQGTISYEIRLNDRTTHLINAVTGQEFKITSDLAKQYVLNSFPTAGRVVRVEQIDQYDYAYQWGSLPAYRIVLDSDPSVDFYVTVNDGTVRRSNRWDRLRGAMERIHTFQPLKLITNRDELRKGLLLLLSLVGMTAAVTGYCLAFSRRA